MMKNRLFWVLLVIALALGLLITWVDSRPTWDDTGISAGAILLVTAALGLAMPERAWLWALAVGGWIPLMGIFVTHNYGSILALVVAFIGAYLGALARKAFNAVVRAGQGSQS